MAACNYTEEWCRGTELNCRHQPFQGCALPTELPRHTYFLQSYIRGRFRLRDSHPKSHQMIRLTVLALGRLDHLIPVHVDYNRVTSVVCCPNNSIAACCLARSCCA